MEECNNSCCGAFYPFTLSKEMIYAQVFVENIDLISDSVARFGGTSTFNLVKKVIQNCFHFVFPYSVIGLEDFCQNINQSDAKQTPILATLLSLFF